MSRLQRILSLSIALLMLLSVFSACAGTDDPKPSGTTPSAETTAPDEQSTEPEDNFYADRTNAKDSLPEKMDFGGADIRILDAKNAKNNLVNLKFFAESSTDVVEEAVYRRNELVKERLNINMVDCNENGETSIDDRLALSVTSFSDDYDISAGDFDNMINGCFLDIVDLDYIDWDAPWWNQSYIEAATVEGRLFTISGEFAVNNLASSHLLYFNKELMQDIHGDLDVYQLVRDGAWTLDKMTELCENVYRDLNGDGLYDEDDLYGNLMAYDTMGQVYTYAGGSNLEYTKYDTENGCYVWALENEKTASFLEKCKKLLFTNNLTFTYENNYKDSDYQFIVKLTEGTALFTASVMSTTQYMRDMPDPGFGILPSPKYDENQAQYTTYCSGFSTVSLPTTTQIADVVGAFLEALCAQSYRTVTPAYFDTAVKSKYARDEESAEMLDIIAANQDFDPLHVFSSYIEWNAVTVISKILAESKLIDKGMSLISKYTKTVNKQFADLPGLIAAIG